MDSNELLKNYDKYTEEWMNEEVKLSNFIEKWLYGEVIMTNEEVQKVFDGVEKKIKEKQIEAEKSLSNYLIEKNKEIMSINALSRSNMSVVQPKKNNKNIFKTFEEKKGMTQNEIERGRQLHNIKLRIMRKEINIEKASQLLKIVNETYGIEEVVDQDSLLDMLNGLKF